MEEKHMNNITAQFEALPKWAKIILLLPFLVGGLVSSIYRIIRYTETKNTTTLVVGILGLICIGPVLAIIDIVTEVTDDKNKVLAD